MILYLDSSAIVKLVVVEPQSDALRAFLASHSGDRLLTNAIARTEVVRATRTATGGNAEAVARARTVLEWCELIPAHIHMLDLAGDVPGRLRSLDAIHIASASFVAPQLRAVVTYDARMHAAAEAAGLPVSGPA